MGKKQVKWSSELSAGVQIGSLAFQMSIVQRAARGLGPLLPPASRRSVALPPDVQRSSSIEMFRAFRLSLA